MNLIKKLSDNELKMFDNYRCDYATYEARHSSVPIEEILKVWESEKSEYLYTLLGEKFIISKDIKCMKTKEELSGKVDKLLWTRGGVDKRFVEAWRNFIYEKFTELKLDKNNPEFMMYYNMDQLMLEDSLISNTYGGETFYVDFPNGDKYKVQKGCKVSKALGKIADAFELPGFEEFRIAHSQILNEKELRGRLHLSIHPLDYATMSDNDCDWNSCMNWMDNGEYRRGTVEMMNSACVVVAYLSSSEDMKIRGGEWSNKKWRELFIVTKDCISGIKGYPYWNRELEKITLDWLKELAEQNLGCEYTDKTYNCYNPGGASYVEVDELEEKISVHLVTNAMYNDCYDNCVMYFNKKLNHNIYICYSGASQCLCCGSTMCDFSHEGMLICNDCDDAKFCDKCGCRIEDDDYFYVDGETLCRYCYDDLPYCTGCQEATTGDIYRVYLGADEKVYRWTYADLCYDCYRYGKIDHDNFKKGIVSDYWNREVIYLPVSKINMEDKELVRYIEDVFDVNLEDFLNDQDRGDTWALIREIKN